MTKSQPDYEVIVAGGGASGLSAALVLARALRRTLVVDEGVPRNASSPALHGFLSRDGMVPSELSRIALEQLVPYDTVNVVHGRIVAARSREGHFIVDVDVKLADRHLAGILTGQLLHVELADHSQFTAQRLILATGMVDEVPPIAGLADKWGLSVFHCRYCDGWEVKGRPLALLLGHPASVEHGVLAALQVARYSEDIVWCTGGDVNLDEASRRTLARNGIQLMEQPILRLEGDGGQLERIVFADGPPLERNAAFIEARRHQHSDLARQLGCEFLEDGSVKVNDVGHTSVSGVYAVGDMARRPPAQTVLAAAAGAAAAIAIDAALFHQNLVSQEAPRAAEIPHQ